jgi:hypothetical protein
MFLIQTKCSYITVINNDHTVLSFKNCLMLETIVQKFRNLVINNRYYKFVGVIEDPLSKLNRTPEEHCHNSKNTTFQERGKTTGWGDAIASTEQRSFSPLAAILEIRRVMLFHCVDMVPGIPPVGKTKHERFLNFECSSRCSIYWWRNTYIHTYIQSYNHTYKDDLH